MGVRSRGPSSGPGGARGAVFGHGPRPLLGRPPGARAMMRHAGKFPEMNVYMFHYLMID